MVINQSESDFKVSHWNPAWVSLLDPISRESGVADELFWSVIF